MEGGYHGNTNKTLEVSNYKYKSKGGKGKPKNIYEIPMPDEYRGKYRGKNASENYFKELEKIIQKTSNSNDKISAMIFEPIISCGGQIELPKEFLKKCRKILTEHNIIMICDEVQTGFGRMGEKYWGYELHDIIPDIITLGKPMGNGHPIGAVVCTKKISEKCDNGLEFFSSFDKLVSTSNNLFSVFKSSSFSLDILFSLRSASSEILFSLSRSDSIVLMDFSSFSCNDFTLSSSSAKFEISKLSFCKLAALSIFLSLSGVNFFDSSSKSVLL